VLFIDASSLFVRQGNKNKLTAEQQARILDLYVQRAEMPHVTALIAEDELAANNYNLSVSSYVEAEDTTEAVDIVALNAEIAEIVARQQVLREQIDAIVADLEGTS